MDDANALDWPAYQGNHQPPASLESTETQRRKERETTIKRRKLTLLFVIENEWRTFRITSWGRPAPMHRNLQPDIGYWLQPEGLAHG